MDVGDAKVLLNWTSASREENEIGKNGSETGKIGNSDWVDRKF